MVWGWSTLLTTARGCAILPALVIPALAGWTTRSICWARPVILICMLEPKKKQSVIKKYQTHEGDTGSSEVQIALLSAEIDELIAHLKEHHKDHSSRRGLLRKVSARRRLMKFLKKENPESYEELVKKLKLKSPRVIAKLDGDTKAAEEVLEEDLPEEHEDAND